MNASTVTRSLFAVLALLVAAPASLADARDPEDPSEVYAAYFEEYLALFPRFAIEAGDHRFDHLWENDISERHRAQQAELYQRYAKRAAGLARAELDAEGRLDLDLFVDQLENKLDELAFPNHLVPINHFLSTAYTFEEWGSGGSVHPFDTVADYRHFLARIDGFEAWVETAIENMAEGVERDITISRFSAVKAAARVRALVVEDPTASGFYAPIRDLPAEFSAEDRTALTSAYAAAIERRIVPAYAMLADFLEYDYAPHCRETLAWTALPNGRAWYEALVGAFTTSDLTPQQIFDLGVSEIERIGAELERARANVPDGHSLPHFATPELVAKAYEDTLARSQPRLAEMFDLVPKTPLEIKPSDNGSYYEPGSPDGARPGIFRFLRSSGPAAIGEALFVHEAIPGHHYQMSLQRESDQPAFRKNGIYYAFIEGWGLYAESLGRELGLYSDPLQDVSRLESEAIRALRLVWDVGLHAKGWSFEDCEAFGAKYGFGGGGFLRRELERYAVWPGQALSYKVGERKIIELRERAHERLGDDFDVRAFHSLVLRIGAVPLRLLEASVEQWLHQLESE